MKAHHNSHEEIIRTVIDGEAERAADAMRRHVQTLRYGGEKQ